MSKKIDREENMQKEVIIMKRDAEEDLDQLKIDENKKDIYIYIYIYYAIILLYRIIISNYTWNY